VQVARIDAHLLNRKGVTRLCYCGPVLHTRADRPGATREPYQLGAEIYGHPGLEADLEILALALRGAESAGLSGVVLDMGHARIVPALLEGLALEEGLVQDLHTALGRKDAAEIASLAHHLPPSVATALQALTRLYGGRSVLETGRDVLSAWPEAIQGLDQLAFLADQLGGSDITFDLADLNGYGYYSGVRFAMYVAGTSDALVRGGRYDEVGAVFGRKRPAVGFSLDLKELVIAVPAQPLKAAIRAPWGVESGLREALAQLRGQGETVVCAMPGHESEVDEFNCDRELVHVAGKWVVRDLPHS
jgi:ATP phosphoribosyltransferase regulatory subunit